MSHKWTLSIQQDHAAEKNWLEELSASKIKDFEYSCGRFPSHQEVLTQIEVRSCTKYREER